MENKKFTVLIEGNIGSGKSHFIDLLRDTPKIKTFNEPLNEWENLHGVNLFTKYYSQPKKYSGIFQQYVFQTQWKQFRDNTNDLKIIERSPYSARYVFMELNDSNYICEEKFILDNWFEEITKGPAGIEEEIGLIVYIRTNPEIAYENMIDRGRYDECNNVNRDYIFKVHCQHEKWLMQKQYPCPAPVLVINNDHKDTLKIEAENFKRLLKNLTTIVPDTWQGPGAGAGGRGGPVPGLPLPGAEEGPAPRPGQQKENQPSGVFITIH
jgi:deoxyadenosine/deoxycytidine kinase